MNETDSRLLDVFADTLWLEAGLSKNTLSSYRADLARRRYGVQVAEAECPSVCLRPSRASLSRFGVFARVAP